MQENKQNICPVCEREYEYALNVSYQNGKQYCLHDSNVPGRSKTQLKKHANYEMTKMALEMAAEQKRMDAATGRDKMVDVKSYQKGSEGRTMKLPVGVVESIKQRVNPLIEE